MPDLMELLHTTVTPFLIRLASFIHQYSVYLSLRVLNMSDTQPHAMQPKTGPASDPPPPPFEK
jgi:hypothetical protein